MNLYFSNEEFLYILHQPYRNIIRRCFKITFGINADDGFGIGSAQMYPVIIKFDL